MFSETRSRLPYDPLGTPTSGQKLLDIFESCYFGRLKRDVLDINRNHDNDHFYYALAMTNLTLKAIE